MTSPARTLVAVALLAVVVALVFATGGMLVYRAALGDARTHVRPVAPPTAYRAPG